MDVLSVVGAVIVGVMLLKVCGVVLALWMVCVVEKRHDKRMKSWMQKMKEGE